MWKRKELKQKAKKVVKNNYWTAIIVCFLIALFTGEFGTSTVVIWKNKSSMDPNYIIHNQKILENNQTAQEYAKNSIFDEQNLKSTLDETQLKIFEALEANLDDATKSQKYIFKIWDAISSFKVNEPSLGIIIGLTAIISFLFVIIISDPLIVGGKRYFLKAGKGNTTKAGIMLEVFKRKNWSNVAAIMFLRNLYNALWYLTIIGGVIKTYEYRMIPYILAENPKIKRKQAFKLSKQMMKNNKWKTFVLDMSFFGWNFLSVLTLGIIGILYVNPYNSATLAELYITLRSKAIKEKYEYYEELNDKEIKSK